MKYEKNKKEFSSYPILRTFIIVLISISGLGFTIWFFTNCYMCLFHGYEPVSDWPKIDEFCNVTILLTCMISFIACALYILRELIRND